MPGNPLIVIPTYNEADNLEALLRAVHGFVGQADVLVVDDSSGDGTGALADRLAQVDTRVHVLHRPRKLGLGSAYVAGFRWGLERGYARLVEMDADFSHDPKYLPQLMAALDRGADVAVGSRNVPGGSVQGWGPVRHLISKGGSLYSRLLLHSPVRDMTTGFKAYTRHAVERIGIDDLRSNGYAFQIETTFRALQAGLHVVELPIVFVDRRAGQSKMSRHEVLEAARRVVELRAQISK